MTTQPTGFGPNTFDITGRVAVITGAAGGIGRASALALARFGADLAISDRDAERLQDVAKEVEAIGRRCVVGVLDVRETADVEEHVATAVARFGKIDILVNNAGGGFQAPFMNVNSKGQDSLIRENFTSVTNFVRACVPHMTSPTGGSIINMTSIEAHRAAPGFAIYAAMKTAVMSLSKSLALELAPQLVRVNCIAMDVIAAPGLGDHDFTGKAVLPLNATGEDVAGACVYLAGDASRFVTGSTIHVDGGNLASAGWIRAQDGSFATGFNGSLAE